MVLAAEGYPAAPVTGGVVGGLAAAGAVDGVEVPGMAAHLDGCPACREDHESLRSLVTPG